MDIHIRRMGRAGRITLHRPKALNALTYPMAVAIEKALDDWRDDDAVKLVVIDAEGDKAFCAGGDIQDLYRTAVEGNFEYGRTFWRDEYRLNAKIAAYPKPFVALMQGFVMGGGVGISCHGSHRIACENTQIAMPECGIGLVPDVGGSLLLARAPGWLGEYLGMTGARMDAGNAIYAGFADHFVPRDAWEDLLTRLEATGDANAVSEAAHPAPEATLAAQLARIDALFSAETFHAILERLREDGREFATETLRTLARKSPISVACTPELIRRSRRDDTIPAALAHEFRFTYRSAEDGDFIEGIKAAIIDRTHSARWRVADMAAVTPARIAAMLAPLGENELTLEGETA